MQAIIPNKLKILNDSVPENDAPAWDAATAYHPADPQSGRAADRVLDEHYIYEAMAESSGKQPSANSDYDGAPWRTLNVTNKYACIDLYRSTRTMAPEGVTDLIIQVPFKRPATGFGLLNMAASSVMARVKDGPNGAVIWDGGEKRLIRDTVSLWHYLFEEVRYSVDMVVTGIPPISGVLEITLRGGRPAVGSIVAGEHVSLGRSRALFFAYANPLNARVMQWREGEGQLEYENPENNVLFGEEQYEEYVAPFVALWEAEKARLDEIADRPPTLDEARAAKLADLMAAYDAAFAPVEAAYPAKERETWAIQLEEARAVLADPNAETPMLSIMVAARGKGETTTDLAAIVMTNNAAYRRLAGSLTGQQQRMYAQINALQSVAELQAYEVVFEMP